MEKGKKEEEETREMKTWFLNKTKPDEKTIKASREQNSCIEDLCFNLDCEREKDGLDCSKLQGEVTEKSNSNGRYIGQFTLT